MLGRARVVFAVCGSAAIAAGAQNAFRPVQFTWINSGVRIDYSWQRALGILAAALGLLLLAAAVSHLRARFALLALAAPLLGFSAHVHRYRLLADEHGLSQRGLLGTSAVSWRGIRRVEAGSSRLAVFGPGDARILVATGAFRADDRGRLERTIARRVRESAASDTR